MKIPLPRMQVRHEYMVERSDMNKPARTRRERVRQLWAIKRGRETKSERQRRDDAQRHTHSRRERGKTRVMMGK